MKIPVILLAFLSTVAAKYPTVETLVYSQIDQILKHENITDPGLISCLRVADDFVLGGIFVDGLKELHSAMIPSPSGSTNWTVQELTNAGNIIINYMEPYNKNNLRQHDNTLLTLEELDKALERFPTPHRVDRNDEFINLHILETLHTVATQAEEGKFDMATDTLKILVPAVDMSIWSSAALHSALKEPNTLSEIIPYLEGALKVPLQSFDNGKKFCVFTPVGLMPQQDPFYYIPESTKRLIKMSKVRHPLTRRYNKSFFGIPQFSHNLNLIAN